MDTAHNIRNVTEGVQFCRFRLRPALALPYTGCETGINNESALAAQFPDLLRSSATTLPSGQFFFSHYDVKTKQKHECLYYMTSGGERS